MPKIVRLANVSIYMYADDHAPPHFHMLGPESDALVDLESLRVVRGRFRRRDLTEVRAWASEHADLLQRRGAELNERE